jgi:hypothetical protein|tara:strand:- start:2380 stop:2595 length:216 start_codon:yes stop_codon:yes gene_type:complete
MRTKNDIRYAIEALQRAIDVCESDGSDVGYKKENYYPYQLGYAKHTMKEVIQTLLTEEEDMLQNDDIIDNN